MSKISQKQKLLNELEKQLAELQQEITVLQESNPLYKETWERLKTERDSLSVLINKIDTFVFQDLVEVKYKWKGINKYPEIVDCTFLCNQTIASFLEKTVVEYQILDYLFDVEDDKIYKIKKALDGIDQKVKTFNNKVKKAFKEFQEEQLNELLF